MSFFRLVRPFGVFEKSLKCNNNFALISPIHLVSSFWWYEFVSCICTKPGGEVLLGKMVVRTASLPKTVILFKSKLSFSLPYLWPDQKFETLFQTCLVSSSSKYNLWRAFVDGLIHNDKKWFHLKSITSSRRKNHTLSVRTYLFGCTKVLSLHFSLVWTKNAASRTSKSYRE